MNMLMTGEPTGVAEDGEGPREGVAELDEHVGLRSEVVLEDLQLVVLITPQTA